MSIKLVWEPPKEYVAYGLQFKEGKMQYVVLGKFYSEPQAEHKVRQHAKTMVSRFKWYPKNKCAWGKHLTLGKVEIL